MGASSSICSVEVLQTEFAALKPTLSTAEMEKLQGTFDRTTADKNKTDLEIIAECVVCWASLDLLQKSPAVQVPPTESILVALNEDTLKIILSFLPPHLLTTTIPQTSAAFNHISLSRVIWGPIADKANKFRVEQTVGRERGTVDGMLEAINRLGTYCRRYKKWRRLFACLAPFVRADPLPCLSPLNLNRLHSHRNATFLRDESVQSAAKSRDSHRRLGRGVVGG